MRQSGSARLRDCSDSNYRLTLGAGDPGILRIAACDARSTRDRFRHWKRARQNRRAWVAALSISSRESIKFRLRITPLSPEKRGRSRFVINAARRCARPGRETRFRDRHLPRNACGTPDRPGTAGASAPDSGAKRPGNGAPRSPQPPLYWAKRRLHPRL